MNHFSLFTGIGGVDLAAEWAGFETVGMCEIDEYCRKVLDKHWPNVPKWRDVRDVTNESVRQRGIGKITVLSGGFPCQPFSIAGKRRGKADDRDLWPEMLRVIQELRPRWVLGENVANFVNMELERSLSDLEAEGYESQAYLIPACAVGAPHERKRVFIVGYTEHDGQPAVKEFRGYEEAGDTRGEEKQEQTGQPQGATGPGNVEGIYRGEFGSERRAKREVGGRNPKKNGEDVAHSPRHLLNGSWDAGQAGRGKLTDSGNVAYSDDTGSRAYRNGIDGNGQTENEGWKEQSQCRSRGQCEELANSGGAGLQRPQQEREHERSASQCGWWTVEPDVGRDAYGLPPGMDGHRWPAGPGEQHPWEPPRIATGVKNRVAKLRALGNSVMPAQVYPILKAIAEIELKGENQCT